jgi:hypothetical protein
MLFYHVTSRAAAEEILAKGFEGGWGDVGLGVYLFGSLTSAENYADKGGWDGGLTEPVIIAVHSGDPEKVIPEPSWPNPEDYADVWWVELDEGQTWKPQMEIIDQRLTEDTEEIISAQWEQVWDMIYDAVAELEGKGPYNEVDAAESQPYPCLMLAGYPEDGFNPSVAEKIIAPLSKKIEALGWHRAKKAVSYHRYDEDEYAGSPQTLVFFGWLPDTGKKANIKPSDELFHVTREENYDKIMSDGLKPSHGGSDFIETKNPRVYFTTDYYDIESVINDLRKHRGQDTKLVVFRAHVSDLPNHTFYDDMEVDGDTFVWTDKDVPASALEFWGDADELLF